MDRNSSYYKQVQLLVQLLPLIAEEGCFALKGGTAINLFVRDLPRLSVDIDLVYLPMKGRNEALTDGRRPCLNYPSSCAQSQDSLPQDPTKHDLDPTSQHCILQ